MVSTAVKSMLTKWGMEKVCLSIQLVILTSVNGKMTFFMGKEFISSEKGRFMMELLKMGWKTVKGYIIMITKMFSTKVDGGMTKNIVLEYFIVLNNTTKESGRMVKNKETGIL